MPLIDPWGCLQNSYPTQHRTGMSSDAAADGPVEPSSKGGGGAGGGARRKIDTQGAYLPFPGITVVCNMDANPSVARLPEILRAQPDLGRLLSPLPPESYHVTVLDVCCQYKLDLDDEAWRSFCAEPRWKEASLQAARADFVPRLKVDHVELGHGCLAVVLQPCDEKTPAHPNQVALGCQLAEFLKVKPQKHPWHMTLAYCPEPDLLASLENSALEAQRRVIEDELKRAFPEDLCFGKAQLCRFADMTAFVPWDGEGP